VFYTFIGGHRVHEIAAGVANNVKSSEQYNQTHKEAAAIVIGGGNVLRVV
jgi:hypothetical protein